MQSISSLIEFHSAHQFSPNTSPVRAFTAGRTPLFQPRPTVPALPLPTVLKLRTAQLPSLNLGDVKDPVAVFFCELTASYIVGGLDLLQVVRLLWQDVARRELGCSVRILRPVNLRLVDL